VLFVAYSPLGRGFLTGQVKSFDDFTNLMIIFTRFRGENFLKGTYYDGKR